MLVNLSCNFLKQKKYHIENENFQTHVTWILYCGFAVYTDLLFIQILILVVLFIIITLLILFFLINVTVSYKYEIKYIYIISQSRLNYIFNKIKILNFYFFWNFNIKSTDRLQTFLTLFDNHFLITSQSNIMEESYLNSDVIDFPCFISVSE